MKINDTEVSGFPVVGHYASHSNEKPDVKLTVKDSASMPLQIAALQAEILSLKLKVPKWVAVSERLPENGAYYWTFHTEYGVRRNFWNGQKWDDGNLSTTHWQPIQVPEPPKV